MEHEAEVVGVGAGSAPGGDVPTVVLSVREEYVPIFVSGDQARSIATVLEDEPFDRPLTHDLLVDILTEFGGAIDRVRIDDLADGTFYAKVDVERYDAGTIRLRRASVRRHRARRSRRVSGGRRR